MLAVAAMVVAVVATDFFVDPALSRLAGFIAGTS
jgi:hypothetical protein